MEAPAELDPRERYREKHSGKPRRLVIDGDTWQVRPMKSWTEWAEVVQAVPTIATGAKKKGDRTAGDLAEGEARYRRTFELYVDGLVADDDQVVAIPYEEVLVGHVVKLGDFVLEISGFGGSKVESAGRSLQS